MRHALVTGATGFVGGALVRRLVADGWTVHALVGHRSSADELERTLGPGRVTQYAGTLPSVSDAIHRSSPSAVFHLASRVIGAHTPDDVDALLEANVTLGVHLAEAMSVHAVRNLIVAGSHWQHYAGAEYEPVNLYAATKQALQAILRYYTATGALRLRVVTLFETYGPGDVRSKLLTQLRHAAITGQPLSLSPGDQLVDIVHVDDVVAALLAAYDSCVHDATPELEFAATSGAPLTLRELVGAAERAADRALPVTWGGRPYRPREIMRPWCGTAPPGWAAAIPLDAGLREVFAELPARA